jgi:transcriptional regulator with XRE-family HTH domain
MAAPKRTAFERERDLERTASLYLKGKTQQEIADEIGVSRQQVGFDIQTVQRRWRESTVINLDEAKQRELARIDELERTYWQAWEKSTGERTKTKQEKTGGDGGQAKASVEKETLHGNPAFLTGVFNCVQERCRILGLYAPTKQELGGEVTLQIVVDR